LHVNSQKLTDSHLSLPHGIKQKHLNEKQTKNKRMIIEVQTISMIREGSPSVPEVY